MSIFDGITEYALGQTVMHPAGEDHSGGSDQINDIK
jgi:hypothetical protein